MSDFRKFGPYDFWTYGLELEWSDWDRRIPIPPGCGVIDKEEYTLVNTDGTAVVPGSKKCFYGGEINTNPTGTIKGQVGIVKELIELLNPKLTYRCFLHTHVAVPGLTDHVDSCKRLLTYIQKNQSFINDVVFPLSWPTEDGFKNPEDLKSARKMRRQFAIWSQSKVSDKRYEKIMTATNFQEFYAAHFSGPTSGTKKLGIPGPRAGVNLLSLYKHGTVEFRIFPGAIDPIQIENCLLFSKRFVTEALSYNPVSVEDWGIGSFWNLPKQLPFDPVLERGFQETKRKY